MQAGRQRQSRLCQRGLYTKGGYAWQTKGREETTEQLQDYRDRPVLWSNKEDSVYSFVNMTCNRLVSRLALASGVVLVLVLASAGCTKAAGGASSREAAPLNDQAISQPERDYRDKVYPILKNNCFRCHSGMNHRGGLSMNTRESLLKGGRDGVVVIPGKPETSLLVDLVRHEGPKNDPMPMPPKSKLSDADIHVLTQWVKDGAVMVPMRP